VSSVTKSSSLVRCLSVTDLTLMGIGAIVGAGLFVLTGIAAATKAGPGVILSYLMAGLACSFSALAYAELAASIGGCGSAYGYARLSMGKWMGWIVGWDLLLEYGMNVSTVAIGWAGYLQSALTAVGLPLPHRLTVNPFHGGIINLPAVLIILLMALVLTQGIKSGARFNNLIVAVKLSVIGLFIWFGVHHLQPENWHPFLPFGIHGAIQGAGLVFFAFIGFDAVATAAEETKNPQRDLPLGILFSLAICTLLYVIVAGVLTGIQHYTTLNTPSSVADALLGTGHPVAGQIISIGAIAGLTTTILVMFYGMTRIYLAMARDGILPQAFLKIDPRSHSPNQLIWFTGIIMAAFAGFCPIESVASIVNIATLAAFAIVSGCVILLRYTRPKMSRPFKTPFSPLVPLAGIGSCVYLMLSLPKVAWVGLALWSLGGVVFFYWHDSR